MTAKEIIQGLLDEMYNMGIDEETVVIACDNTGIGEIIKAIIAVIEGGEKVCEGRMNPAISHNIAGAIPPCALPKTML